MKIEVSKIDYYSWKIGAIVLLILLIMMIYSKNYSYDDGEINDNYWHLGYSDCERNYNFTSDEMMILNTYRIYKIENRTNLQGEN